MARLYDFLGWLNRMQAKRYDVTRWLDARKVEWDAANDRSIDEYVQRHLEGARAYSRTADLWLVLEFAARTVAYEMAQGAWDTLNVGQGVDEGGWGYGKDALRVVSLAGPAANGLAFAARTAPPVFRFVTASRAVAVTDILPREGICSWVTAAQAFRMSGANLFVSVSDLAKAAKVPLRELTKSYVDLEGLRHLLARIGVRAQPVSRIMGRTLHHFERYLDEMGMTSSRNGVWVLTVTRFHDGRVPDVAHAYIAFWDVARSEWRFLDRAGVASSRFEDITERVRMGRDLWLDGDALFIPNSTVGFDSLARQGELLSTIVLGVKASVAIWEGNAEQLERGLTNDCGAMHHPATAHRTPFDPAKRREAEKLFQTRNRY